MAALLLPSAATAASNDVIRRLDIAIDIRPDGTLEVTETYDWDFGSRRGLGLTRVLDARFDYPPQPDQVRVYEYGNFAASSPSGAPAGVWTRDEGARVRVDVGAPDGSDDRRTGRQTYVLRYTVDGALNAIRNDPDVPDQDELYWNATGHDWDIPIEHVTVTVTGPADVVDHACYAGRHGSTAECDTLDAAGGQVSAASGRLPAGSGVTIMAAFPAGTFGDISPILRDAPSSTSPFDRPDERYTATAAAADFIWSNAAWVGPLLLALPVAYGVRRVRQGRDLQFADLPPGVLPPPGSTPRVARVTGKPAVAVRFTPPDRLRPGEVGALDDKRASTKHISATLVDLAVRGHLRIHESETTTVFGRPKDWLLVATPQEATGGSLRDYEQTLLGALFGGRRQVWLSQLRNRFHHTMRVARRQLGAGLTQLFSRPLSGGVSTRVFFPLVFGIIIFVSYFTSSTGASTPLSTVFLFLVLLALTGAFVLAAAVTSRASRQRTPLGRALHEQSRGFERYLSTAEAEQLRFEEGADIFSRYLPYAIVYDVADRWTEIFAQLEAQGGPVHRPTWYVGTRAFHSGSFRDLGRAVSSFASTAGSTMSSTPGSSGSSGSRSGGGGFSGGGGGGGGGGGR